MQCCKQTGKGVPCPIYGDRCRDGQWYCHVHDPQGLFMSQQRCKRAEKEKRKKRRERRIETGTRYKEWQYEKDQRKQAAYTAANPNRPSEVDRVIEFCELAGVRAAWRDRNTTVVFEEETSGRRIGAASDQRSQGARKDS